MLSFIDKLTNIQRTLIIGGLLLLGLSSLYLSVARIHATGTQVVLATMPVDPRSLFQGDYVILNYKISRLEDELFAGKRSSRPNAMVYVELQPGEPVWTPVYASNEPIKPAAGNVVIKGRSNYRGIMYGIESFLVPEGEGLAIEQLRNASDRVTVRVLVAPDGAALPQNVLVDGRPVFKDGGL